MQNILYKLFATIFVWILTNFYNFIRNNYPWSNYLQIKILRKNNRKKYFLVNFVNKFAEKSSCSMRMRIFSNVIVVGN